MISTGLYNRTLVLQRYTETNDGMGGVTHAWADAGSFRARISPLNSQERLMQDKATATTTHRIYCDNIDIFQDDRVKWSTDNFTIHFEIIGITNPSEAYHHLEIDVRELA